jgi:hypothetical protein
VLFGGIHDITWEMDDLHAFDATLQEWEAVDEDSSRRKEAQALNGPSQQQPDTSPTKQGVRKAVNKGDVK